MAPSLSSLRVSRPSRTRSLGRENLDPRWGDQSITAPTYQKPGGTPIVPSEWASPATTLVDSSPDIGFEKSISPVETRTHHLRDTLTITIPLPWKRKSSKRSASPLESSAVTRVPIQDPHENFASPDKELISPETQRDADQYRQRTDSTSHGQYSAPPQSARLLDLKSPVFPVSPISREPLRPARNVDFLTSELDNLALGRKARSRKDNELTPIDGPEHETPVQTQRPRSIVQTRSPIHTSTPMFSHFPDVHQRPVNTDASHYNAANHPPPMTVTIRPGQQVTVSVLTPVEERHERGQASPEATSIEASPSSPTVPALDSNSLARIASTPVDATKEAPLSQASHATNPVAAVHSHPTSTAPRARSRSRHSTRRQESRERRTVAHNNRSRNTSCEVENQPSVAREPSCDRQREAPRRSSTRRAPSASSRIPSGHAYRRSSDLTTRRRVPSSISIANPQKTIHAAYFRRSRSMEPTPSPRLALDPARSPTDTLSSGSTDVEPLSEDESLFSPNDPDRYFEARQMWNGVAGEGRKGFYANVVDDYRMIGRDVSVLHDAEIKRKTMLLEKPKPTPVVPVLKKIGTSGGDGRVKIAGLDPEVVVGGQQLVPTSEELWG